jgi:hypothetical protein
LDESTENGISIYPNPTNNFVTITTGNLTSGFIVITDVLGRELYTIQFTSATTLIEFSSAISRGTYFIQIYSETNDLIATKKLIKN